MGTGLANLRIASPCSANWELMQGDEQARFCQHCQKHVYNLSAMTRVDAEDLLRRTEGRVCTRFYRRADGTILTEDCPVGLRAKAARVRRRLEIAVSGILGFAGLAAAQQPAREDIQIKLEASDHAAISGVVTDPTGAVIPKARITIKGGPRIETKLSTTDNAGRFQYPALTPGAYSLKVESPGFRTSVKNNLELDGRHQVGVEVTLEVAGTDMGVMVSINPPKTRN